MFSSFHILRVKGKKNSTTISHVSSSHAPLSSQFPSSSASAAHPATAAPQLSRLPLLLQGSIRAAENIGRRCSCTVNAIFVEYIGYRVYQTI
jgi:hypothetical protein